MYILTNDSDIVIMHCTSVTFDKNSTIIDGSIYISGFLNAYEIPDNSLPVGFEANKYCYNSVVGFYPNPLFKKDIELDDVKSTLIKISLDKSPLIDKDICSLDEYKAYVIKTNSIACTNEIEQGIDVTIDGKVEHFSLTMYDQADLDRLYTGIQLKNPEKVSYHADGEDCRLYLVKQFLEIYAAYQFRLLFHKTYYNQLNMMVRSSMSKEEVSQVIYGIRLVGDRFDKLYNIMYSTMVTTLNMSKELLDILIENEFVRISS